MDPPRDDLTRISVDSLQDWQRIKTNYATAAFAALDEELSQSGSTSEREALRLHVQQFIERAFELTRPNLRVNGRNFEEVDTDEQEEEPFDEGFDRHIWSLAEQSLKWDREIAEKRRHQPKEVEKLMESLLERQREVDQELAEEEVDDDEHMDDVQDDLHATTYENISEVAMKLNAITDELLQSVPLQAERAERVQVFEAEIKALKP